MTKEKLEKEAIFYAENIIPADTNYYLTKRYSKEQIQQAYLAGAEPREKRIAELEAQIEKMKRCEICKHYQWKSCNYHSNWVKQCKENGMKLFELKEIKKNE